MLQATSAGLAPSAWGGMADVAAWSSLVVSCYGRAPLVCAGPKILSLRQSAIFINDSHGPYNSNVVHGSAVSLHSQMQFISDRPNP